MVCNGVPGVATHSALLRCYKAANDPAYGADDAVDGERSGEGSGNPG